jgi:hypothetical protein
MFAVHNNADWLTLDDCIKNGIRIKGEKRPDVWVAMILKVKLEDNYLWFWWFGKWRLAGEWNRKTKPSNK